MSPITRRPVRHRALPGPDPTRDRAAVRVRYRRFADEEASPGSLVYARLARAVADDDDITRYVAALADTQPNLLFAAVQYLLGPTGMPTDAPSLRALILERGEEIASLVRDRRVQTNEVARCAIILPALPREPLALLEVGASAGLCLLLDRYRYEYGRTSVGDVDAGVRLRCRVSGPAPLPSALPVVVWRRGVDIAPVDIDDPDAVRWLAACVWSDQTERRVRLEAALRVARADPPRVDHGDLVDELPRLVAEAPPEARVVVFHGGVLPYLDAGRRAAFAAALAAASHDRPVTWISMEAPGVVLEPPRGVRLPRRLRMLLGRTTFDRGERRDEVLAVAHPHGEHLRWSASGPPGAVRVV